MNPNYPTTNGVGPSLRTVAGIQRYGCRDVAEVGIRRGATSMAIAKHLREQPGATSLHLFDYFDCVEDVVRKITSIGYGYVHGYPNSQKTLDSYNWSLMLLLREGKREIFDYVYLDGAHSWGVDALAFFLLDKLLRPGGYIELDDYEWCFAQSATLRPSLFPKTKEFYTDDQISTPQVKLIVELLIKDCHRYVEVERNRTYRKVR
jgi:hypothetical protein